MKSSDKFLVAIAVGAIILILLTLVVVLNRPEVDYQESGAPESIVHNYLLALRKLDYEKAAGYLAECLADRPTDGDEFALQINRERWYFDQLQQDTAFYTQPTIITGEHAVVRVVQRTFYNNGLFDNREYSDELIVTLQRMPSGWKIIHSDRYWLPEKWLVEGCS